MSLQTRSHLSSFILSSFAFAIATLPAGCAAPVSDASQTSHSALDQDGDDPASDPDLAFVLENGFSSFAFAESCISTKDGGSPIEGDPVPVGGGRILTCKTFNSLTRATTGAVSMKGDHWCALGEAQSSKGGGDKRLEVSITSSPADAPWTLTATHEGDEIQIGTAEGFGGARAWTVWAEVTYHVVQMKREVEGKNCDELFGL